MFSSHSAHKTSHTQQVCYVKLGKNEKSISSAVMDKLETRNPPDGHHISYLQYFGQLQPYLYGFEPGHGGCGTAAPGDSVQYHSTRCKKDG